MCIRDCRDHRACYIRSVIACPYDRRNIGRDNGVYVLSSERDQRRCSIRDDCGIGEVACDCVWSITDRP